MEMNDFPKGWETAEIGDLCNLINGRAFKSQEWAESGLPIIRIQNLNSQKSKFNYFSGELDNRHLVSNGDLLFAWSGTPGTSFGAHVWNGPDAALNQHIFKIEFSEECIGRNFLRYAIDQKLDELIGSAQGGVGLRHVTKGTFEKTVIAFPPRTEQTRIAQKLDELLVQINTLKSRIEAIPAVLKRLRQSILAAAVSGRLTEDWRGDHIDSGSQYDSNNLPVGWAVLPLGRYAINHDGARKPISAKERESRRGKHPYFGATGQIDCIDGYTHDGEYVLVGEDGANLLTRAKPLAFIAKGQIWVNNHAHVIACPNGHSNAYLAIYLNTLDITQWVSGSAQPKLNQKNMNEIPVHVAPAIEQIEIVRRVEQLFVFVDQLEAKVASAKSRIDHLTQSVLAKAFRGELVPQDPNDEPAGMLLARIQAQRTGTPKAKRGRKSI
jgi:type I restriction enzyme, S subunit